MNVLVVGTSVIDVFFSAQSDHYSIAGKKVLLQLGDKIPISVTKISLGGNGANVSVALKRMGILSSFYTYMGDDMLADEIKNVLMKEGVRLSAQTQRNENTAIHLIFNFDEDRIIFSGYTVREYIFDYKYDEQLDFVYLTSIPKEWTTAYTQVLAFVKEKNVKLAFSPGSRQLDDLGDVFLKTIQNTHILFVNKEEGELIVKKLGKNSANMNTLLITLKSLGPSIVSVTDGENGAYCINQEGKMHYISSFSDNAQTIQKTGAGDAYASAFLASLMYNNQLSETMRWGAFNAHAVMQHLGAQDGLLHREELEKLSQRHTDFKIKEL